MYPKMSALKIKKSNILREGLLFSILLYFSQGVIFPKGTILTQLVLVAILLISFFYSLKVILSKDSNSIFIWSWYLLFLINSLGYFLTMDLRDPLFESQFRSIAMNIIVFFPMYYMSKKEFLREKHIIRFFIIMIVLSVLVFFNNESDIISNRNSGNTNVVNNSAYYFVMLLPYVFLFNKKIISNLYVLIIMFFLIQGSKRGALIVGSFGLIVYIYYQFKVSESKNRLRNYLLSLASLIVLVYFSYTYLMSNLYLISRLQSLDEGGSGRVDIYSNIIMNWFNSENIANFIFGYGFASSVKLSGTGSLAHNDWLELLSNFGLIGFAIYASIFIGLGVEVSSNKFTSRNRFIIITISLMWFITTLFSMFYTSSISVLMVLLLAFVLGQKHKVIRNSHENNKA